MTALFSRFAGRMSLLLAAALVISVAPPVLAADAKPTDKPILISDITDRFDSINITAGRAEGIKVGAKGIILRDGKKIADYEVVQVNWGFSRIAVSNLAEGYKVRVGDSAPITGYSTEPAKTKTKPSWTKYVWYALGAGALIYLLSNDSGGSSSGSATIELKGEKKTTFGDTNTSTITITATVKDGSGGYVPDGTLVTFTTTSGTLSLTQSTTSLGKATVILTGATTDPPGTVTARSGGATASLTVNFGASVQLEVTPTTIQLVNSGGAQTQATVTATCRDAQGNPPASGKVEFDTGLGRLGNSSVDIVNGVATTTLTSDSAGKSEVTATWQGTTARVTVTFTAGPPTSLTVSSSSPSVQCDGNSYATITATVKDIGGNLATDGTVVKFSVIPDSNGGGNGTITPQVVTSGGTARASLITKDSAGAVSKSGTATVKVEVLASGQPEGVPAPAADLVNQSTQVQFVSVNVGQIGLGASPRNIRGWDMNTDKSTITAVVKNTDNAPVPDGTVVSWSATHGMINPTSSTTGGVATTTLQADASGDSSWNGLVNVTATAGGVSVTSVGLVVFSGWPSPSKCSASISQTDLAKTGGQATIYVEAKDVNGNPIVDGTNISATTSKGTLSPTSASTTNGVVMFTLSTSSDSGNPTPTGPGKVTITIPSGGNNPETGGLPVTLTVDFNVI